MSEERYKNGKIYTIRCRTDDSLIYVGSSCLSLCKRWYQHKIDCFNEKNQVTKKCCIKQLEKRIISMIGT